ncbi:MAG: hypothetical protein WC322_06550 [Candidatus Paceibacterota bacterium]|jgi:hypothetical protein
MGNPKSKPVGDLWFADQKELRDYIASMGKLIGWTYEMCVWMANNSSEMDYPELRVEIQKCVWMLQYAEQMEGEA